MYAYNPLLLCKLDRYIPELGKDIDGGLYSDTYVNTADVDGGTF